MATSSMKSAVLHLRKVLLRDVAGLTDSQLLDSFVAERDERAFETIVRRHGPMVLGVCRRILGSVHNAEDAFQAVFLVLARKAASISRKELLANWLYGVAQRTSLTAKAKMARRHSHEIPVKDMPQSAAKAPAPCNDWLPLLDAELSKLADKYRIPIVLCDLEGRTRQEAARRLNIPEGTLSSRLATARKLLAQRLGRHGSLLSGGALAVVLAQNAASATVPTTIISATVAAAASVAAGKVLPAGVVSAQVTALAEGVLKAMLLTKLKIATLVLLTVALFGSGIGMLALPAMAEKEGAKDGPGEPPVQAKAPKPDLSKLPVDIEPKSDLQKLHGAWTLAETHQHGKKVAFKDIAIHGTPIQSLKLAIDGKTIPKHLKTPRSNDTNVRVGGVDLHFNGNNQGKGADGDFQLNATKNPKEITMSWFVLQWVCIYKVEGDTLTICFNPKNYILPDDFRTMADSDRVLFVFKREQPDEALKKEKDLLQGIWHMVEVNVGGKHQAKETSKDQILVFTPDKLVIQYDDGSSQEMMVQIDPKQKPKAIDLAPIAEPERGYTFKGIYELDGDRLKLYYSRNVHPNAKRPAQFDPEGEDRGRRSFVLKRAPAAKEIRRVTFRAHLPNGKLADEPQIRPTETILVVPDPAEPYLAHKPLKVTLPKKVPYAGKDELYYLIGFAVGRSGAFNGQPKVHSNVTEARLHKSWNDGWVAGYEVGLELEKAKEPDVKPKADVSQPIRSLPGHINRLTALAYSPDGTSIATASWDGTARVWDAKTGKEVQRLGLDDARLQPGEPRANTFHQIAFSPDNAYIVTAKRESTDKFVVSVWDRNMRDKVREWPGWRFAISPDGKHIACAKLGETPFIQLYELATGKLIREMSGPYSRVDLQTFSPDGKTLYAKVGIPRPPLGGNVQRLGRDGTQVRAWDVVTGKERQMGLEGVWNEHQIAISPDARTLAVRGLGGPKSISHNHTGGIIALRETAGGGQRIDLTGHADDVMDVAFSPDGRTLASGSMDGTVRLWDLPSGKEIACLGKEVDPFKGGWVLAIAFSPDGRTLVSGGLNKTADIWDVSRITGRPRVSAERSPAELETDWKDLGGDAAKGYAALGRLVSSPEGAVSFLGKQLQSAKPPDTQRIDQLIANLDDGSFEVREEAANALGSLGELAVSRLQKARAGKPSLEVSRRLDALLERLDGVPLSAETLSHIRAVETLEYIGNPEANRWVKKFATGPPEMRLTQEAVASARRLAKRSSAGP